METRIGIDIGGTGVKVARLASGEWSLGTSDRYQRPSRGTVAEAIRQALRSAGHEPGQSARVGLCVPGIPSQDQSRIEIAVNVPGLIGWPFADLVTESLGCEPLSITRVSDAEAAASDWIRTHPTPGRVLVLVLGTGVGMAVMDEGIPLHIIDGSPGHIGQVDVSLSEDAPIGPDSGRGSLEAYVGAHAVTSASSVEAAFAPRSEATKALIRAIRICHAMYRPCVIVLMGGIGNRLRDCPWIREGVQKDLTRIASPDWQLAFGEDDYHAARGVALLAAWQNGSAHPF